MSKNTTSHHQRKKRQLLARDRIRQGVDGWRTGYVFRCYLCYEEFPPYQLEIEHKIPKSRGGTDELVNLGLSCQPCNTDKANMTVDEYREYKAQRRVGNQATIRKTFITDIWQGRLTHAISDYWPDRQDDNEGKQ